MKKTLLILSLIVGSFSYGQVAVGSGTSVDSNAGLSTPISIYYSTSLSQQIYLASEIGTGGTITSIDFKVNTAGSLVNSNGLIDVWLGHSTRAAYNPVVSTTGADWISVAGHTKVMTNGSFTQSGTTLTFTFATPFIYNGTDNLIVTVDANKSGDDGSTIKFLQTATTTAVMSLMIRTDAVAENADPLNPPLNYTGSTPATSVQAKNTRPQIIFNGLSLGVQENNLANAISIYPNPVTNNLFIKSNSNVLTADLYTLTGQLIKSQKVDENKIQTAELASGIYIIKLNMEDGEISTQKFVKE